MKNTFLAKSSPKETIMEHTDEVLRQLSILKELYPESKFVDWELVRMACLYHDIGKMNTKFQNKLRKALGEPLLEDNIPNVPEIQHGYLSAAFLDIDDLEENMEENKVFVLYQSIYYHHARPNNKFSDIETTINQDLIRYKDSFLYREINKSELTDEYEMYVSPKNRIKPEDKEANKLYVMTKGLLNRVDYAASAHIDVEIANDSLFEKTNEFIRKLGKPNDLQQYMMKNQDKNLVVIASTGIGKTEGALFWIGNNKGFFSLPLKVSINAIYDRMVEKINFKNTALLHSDTSTEYLLRADKKSEDLDLPYLEKTKQLCMPLTICTVDQLIDYIFRYEGYEMKLATLAYSKLVIDEIQMYSPDLVAFLLIAIKQMTDLGGKFCIVTATFPPIFEYFMNVLEIPYQKPDKVFLKSNAAGKAIKRHKMEVINKDISLNHLLENYPDKKVLVIVNTVKKAQELYDELLRANVSSKLLHSRFILKDRAEKEQEILYLGDRNTTESGIWITTQIVEASLDIDFDVLYTELSDASGLFQRVGRVYRNRELMDDQTNIFVYTGNEYTSGINEGKNSVIDETIFKRSKEILQRYEGIIKEETKMEIVESVYAKEGLENSNYFHIINSTINKYKDTAAYELEKNEIRLRNIYTETIIPFQIYTKNQEHIQSLEQRIKNAYSNLGKLHYELDEIVRAHERNELMKEILRLKKAIMDYTVSIPNFQYMNAKKQALVENFVEVSNREKIPVVSYKYSSAEGLKFELDTESSFF